MYILPFFFWYLCFSWTFYTTDEIKIGWNSTVPLPFLAYWKCMFGRVMTYMESFFALITAAQGKKKLNHHIYLRRLEDIIPSAPTYPYIFFMWRTEKLLYEILQSFDNLINKNVWLYLEFYLHSIWMNLCVQNSHSTVYQ